MYFQAHTDDVNKYKLAVSDPKDSASNELYNDVGKSQLMSLLNSEGIEYTGKEEGQELKVVSGPEESELKEEPETHRAHEKLEEAISKGGRVVYFIPHDTDDSYTVTVTDPANPKTNELYSDVSKERLMKLLKDQNVAFKGGEEGSKLQIVEATQTPTPASSPQKPKDTGHEHSFRDCVQRGGTVTSFKKTVDPDTHEAKYAVDIDCDDQTHHFASVDETEFLGVTGFELRKENAPYENVGGMAKEAQDEPMTGIEGTDFSKDKGAREKKEADPSGGVGGLAEEAQDKAMAGVEGVGSLKHAETQAKKEKEILSEMMEGCGK
jgi:hypothetical protein